MTSNFILPKNVIRNLSKHIDNVKFVCYNIIVRIRIDEGEPTMTEITVSQVLSDIALNKKEENYLQHEY